MNRSSIALLAIAAATILPLSAIGPACAQARTHPRSGAYPARDASMVMTADGPVRGRVAGNHREFLGLPYAAPPTGELRWKPPISHAAWTTAWDATRFRSRCAQVSFMPGLANDSSEDCLYLNIYTHNPARRHLPVMVWIHGGTFVVG
jgi:para-nitrobenzyl esterase